MDEGEARRRRQASGPKRARARQDMAAIRHENGTAELAAGRDCPHPPKRGEWGTAEGRWRGAENAGRKIQGALGVRGGAPPPPAFAGPPPLPRFLAGKELTASAVLPCLNTAHRRASDAAWARVKKHPPMMAIGETTAKAAGERDVFPAVALLDVERTLAEDQARGGADDLRGRCKSPEGSAKKVKIAPGDGRPGSRPAGG